MLGINIFRMLNLCSIVVAILKMVTGRNFSMSGIDSGHHNLPTYQMSKGDERKTSFCHLVSDRLLLCLIFYTNSKPSVN
jgi:hypothetical protein